MKNNKRLDIEYMNYIVKIKDGKCLSNDYINNHTKLIWQCRNNHTWDATYSNIKKGRWCPFCAGNAKLTIDEMRCIAKERNGLCLSDAYINNIIKLEWKCVKGHIWWATPLNIKMGKWCPKCGNKKYLDIESELLFQLYWGNNYSTRQIARLIGGKCGSMQIYDLLKQYRIPTTKKFKYRKEKNIIKYRLKHGNVEYTDWRKAVYERDKYICQICGKIGGRLNAHHIKEWTKYPELRFDISNGITVCQGKCHQIMAKRE